MYIPYRAVLYRTVRTVLNHPAIPHLASRPPTVLPLTDCTQYLGTYRVRTTTTTTTNTVINSQVSAFSLPHTTPYHTTHSVLWRHSLLSRISHLVTAFICSFFFFILVTALFASIHLAVSTLQYRHTLTSAVPHDQAVERDP